MDIIWRTVGYLHPEWLFHRASPSLPLSLSSQDANGQSRYVIQLAICSFSPVSDMSLVLNEINLKQYFSLTKGPKHSSITQLSASVSCCPYRHPIQVQLKHQPTFNGESITSSPHEKARQLNKIC